jgi:hypothetical protein
MGWAELFEQSREQLLARGGVAAAGAAMPGYFGGHFIHGAQDAGGLQGIAVTPGYSCAAACLRRKLLDQAAFARTRLPADERDFAGPRAGFPQVPEQLLQLSVTFQQLHEAASIC